LAGYEERFRFGEDFDLWCRLARRHTIHNLPETLVVYRSDPGSLTGSAAHPAREGYPLRKARLILDNLRDVLGEDAATPQAVDSWIAFGDAGLAQSGDDVREGVAFVDRCAARCAVVCGEAAQVAADRAAVVGPGLREGGA